MKKKVVACAISLALVAVALSSAVPEWTNDSESESPASIPLTGFDFNHPGINLDYELELVAIDELYEALSLTHIPVAAYLKNNPEVCGFAIMGQDAYEKDKDTYVGMGFIPTTGTINCNEHVGSELILKYEEAITEGNRFLWTSLVTLEPVQVICLDHHIAISVTDSVFEKTFTPLATSLYDGDDRAYETALKRAYQPTLGEMYSRDQMCWIVNPIGYEPVKVRPMYRDVNCSELKKVLSEIIEEQESNFMTEEFNTIVMASMDLVIAGLLKPGSELNGYDYDQLLEYADGLASDEILTMGEDGPYIFKLQKPPASNLERWLVGIASGIVIAASLVCIGLSTFFTFGAAAPLVGAIAGAAIGFAGEIFEQVVKNGVSLSDVDYNKVLLETGVGLVSGLFTGAVSGFIADSLGEGIAAAGTVLLAGGSISLAMSEGIDAATMAALFGGGLIAGSKTLNKCTKDLKFTPMKPDNRALKEMNPDDAHKAQASLDMDLHNSTSYHPSFMRHQSALDKGFVGTGASETYRHGVIFEGNDISIDGEPLKLFRGEVSLPGEDTVEFIFFSPQKKTITECLSNHDLIKVKHDPKKFQLIMEFKPKTSGEYLDYITLYLDSMDHHAHYKSPHFEKGAFDTRDILHNHRNNTDSVREYESTGYSYADNGEMKRVFIVKCGDTEKYMIPTDKSTDDHQYYIWKSIPKNVTNLDGAPKTEVCPT